MDIHDYLTLATSITWVWRVHKTAGRALLQAPWLRAWLATYEWYWAEVTAWPRSQKRRSRQRWCMWLAAHHAHLQVIPKHLKEVQRGKQFLPWCSFAGGEQYLLTNGRCGPELLHHDFKSAAACNDAPNRSALTQNSILQHKSAHQHIDICHTAQVNIYWSLHSPVIHNHQRQDTHTTLYRFSAHST